MNYFNITAIELSKSDNNYYSANIVINDDFIITCSGNDDESDYHFPHNDEDNQMTAYNNLDLDDIVREIETDGFENNIGYLEDNS